MEHLGQTSRGGGRNRDAKREGLEDRRSKPFFAGAHDETTCISDEAGRLLEVAEEVDTAV
jgi:hypothetical protein